MAFDRTGGAMTGPKVTVHILRGKASRKSREMKGPTLLIGSEPHCDVQMRSREVAGRHCLISRREGRVLVAPFDAAYPVLLNGVAVQEGELANGDKLIIGPFELSVTIEADAQVAVEPATAKPTAPPLEVAETKPAATPNLSAEMARQTEQARQNDLVDKKQVEEIQKQQTPSAPTQTPATTPTPATAATTRYAEPVGKLLKVEERLRSFQKARTDPDSEVEVVAKPDPAKQFAQLQEQKTTLERGYRSQVEREQELIEKSKEIKRRETAVRVDEQEVEQRRLSLTEELLDVDRRKQTYERKSTKLIRVRRRLFQQYRQRRESMARLIDEIETRAAGLDNRKRELDREISHWKQVGDEMARQQAEIRQQAADVASRLAERDREEKEMAGKKVKLEQDIHNSNIRQRSLDSFQDDLNQRKQRVSEEEAAIRTARESVDEELREARERAMEVQRRHEEIEGKARVVDKQEAHLKDRAKSLEQQRVAQLDLDRDLAARSAAFERKESEQRVEDERQKTQSQRLNILESELKEQARIMQTRDSELTQMAEDNVKHSAELRQRSAEIESHAQTILDELETERSSLEAKRQEMVESEQQIEQNKQRLQLERDQWTARLNETREQLVELAQRADLLDVRTRMLDESNAAVRARQEEADGQAETLRGERDKLEREKSEVEVYVAQTNDKANAIRAEAERVQGLMQGLEVRQKEMLEREQAWVEEVKKRRAELSAMSEELERKRSSLEREAAAHRQHVKKLREVSFKVIERRKQSQEDKAERDRAEDAFKEQLESLRFNQQRIRESILDYVEQAAEREQTSLRWLDGVRSENVRLADAQREFSRSFQEVFEYCRRLSTEGTSAGDAALLRGKVERMMDECSARLRTMQQTISDRASELTQQESTAARVKQPLDSLLSLIEDDPLAVPPVPPLRLISEETAAASEDDVQEVEPEPAPRVQAPVAKPAPAAAVEPSNGGMTDGELIARIERAGLCKREQLLAAQKQAMLRSMSLRDAVVAEGLVSRYQLANLIADPNASFKIGDLTVMDLVHVGAVASTFQVRQFNHKEPMALRLLAPRWCRDESMRQSFAFAVESVTAFRHPNVAAVRQLFAMDKQYGVVCDYVPGRSLADLTAVKIPPKALVSYCHQIVNALSAAQRSGIVHHHLRPSRIMLHKDGYVQILGYGEPAWLGKVHRCEKGRAATVYVAPEEMAGDSRADVRADLFSVGRIVMAAMAGKPIVDARELTAYANGYPKTFVPLITKMVEQEPIRRPASATEALSVLEEMVIHPDMNGDHRPELPKILEQTKPAETMRKMAA